MSALSRKASNPDRVALMRAGQMVRNRLAADPRVHRVETDQAEIFTVGDFLDEQDCARMMAMIDMTAQPSAMFEQDYVESFRTSYSGNVERQDPFVRKLDARIDGVLGMRNAYGETIQGQRYTPGQEFKPHYDWFSTGAAYWPKESKAGGQRSWTAMVYLNDVEEGGETLFSTLGLSVPPQRGVLLLWNNAAPTGEPNEATLHAGTPVIKGTKYVITKWYRTRRWG